MDFVGVVTVAIGLALIYLASQVKAKPGDTNVTLNIDLPADVKMDEFKCQSCGGALTMDNIQMVAGAPVVNCPYCKSVYQLKKNPSGDRLMKRIYTLILVIVLLSLPAVGLAQSYYFSLDSLTVDVFLNGDGTMDLLYRFAFTNLPGSAPIDFVDVGLPNDRFEILHHRRGGRRARGVHLQQ